jgi:excinuclease ABC subunit C
MGRNSVGSRVAFYMAEPHKMGYRRYKVEEEGFPDDYAMMHEVLSRRFSKWEEEPPPDLVIVDGGKGQLNVAVRVIKEYGLDVDAVGLAKEGFDKIFLPGRKNPVILKTDSKSLHLLQRIRDESHRFAIQYHRLLRKKSGLETKIDSIPGVGTQRKKRLLQHFGSLEHLSRASVEDMTAVKGINRSLAHVIYSFLQRETEEQTERETN